jgi:hypothetical protein
MQAFSSARAELKAAGLSARAASALAGVGVRTAAELRERAWSGEDGLRAALLRSRYCGLSTVAAIEAWLGQGGSPAAGTARPRSGRTTRPPGANGRPDAP